MSSLLPQSLSLACPARRWSTRPAKADDLDWYLALAFEAFGHLYPPSEHARRRERWRAGFHPGQDRLVLRGGARVGVLTVLLGNGHVFLDKLALTAERRGAGLGADLVRAVQAEAAARALPVELTVHTQNRALALYERLGFVPVLEAGDSLRLRWIG